MYANIRKWEYILQNCVDLWEKTMLKSYVC